MERDFLQGAVPDCVRGEIAQQFDGITAKRNVRLTCTRLEQGEMAMGGSGLLDFQSQCPCASHQQSGRVQFGNYGGFLRQGRKRKYQHDNQGYQAGD